MNCHPGIIPVTSVSEISAGQLLLGAAAGATTASEEGEVCIGNMTAAGYLADLSASSAVPSEDSSVPPRLSRLRRKSFEAAADSAARLSSTSSESRSEGEVTAKTDSKSPA